MGLARGQHGPEPQLFLKSQHALCSETGHGCLALVRAALGLGGKAERNRELHTHTVGPSLGVGASMQTLLRTPGMSMFRKTRCKHFRSPHTQEPTTCSFSTWTP